MHHIFTKLYCMNSNEPIVVQLANPPPPHAFILLLNVCLVNTKLVVEDSMAITIARTNFEFLCDVNLIIFSMHVTLLETNHAIVKFSPKRINLKYDCVICQMHLYSFHSF